MSGFSTPSPRLSRTHGARDSAQPAEGLLVQLGPDARAGLEGEQAHGLAAVAEREDKQARAPVPAAVRIADHRTGAVIDLRFLAGRRDDDGAGPRPGLAAQLADEALDALVAAGEAVVIDQVLINGLGVAALAERDLDEVEVGLAGAGRGAPAGHGGGAGVGGHLTCLVGRFWRRMQGGWQRRAGLAGRARVGGRLVGRFCGRPAAPPTGRAQWNPAAFK
jgi:hypothetical protein